MRRFAVIAALLALPLASCRTQDASARPAASVPGVSLAAARAGDAVRLTLTNRSGGPVGYNLCSSALLGRGEDGAWMPVPTDLICTMEIRTLTGGASDSFAYPIPAGLAAGDYSWRATVEVPAGGTRRDVISNPVALP